MPGYHIDRITEDIKREIVAILRELKDPRISGMLTVPFIPLTVKPAFVVASMVVYFRFSLMPKFT